MHDLFTKMQSPDHCLYLLLPSRKVRPRGHDYELPNCIYNLHKQLNKVNYLFNFLWCVLLHCTWQICSLLVLYFLSSIVFCAFYFVFYNLQHLFMLLFQNLHVRLIYAIIHLFIYFLFIHLLTYLLTLGYGTISYESGAWDDSGWFRDDSSETRMDDSFTCE